MYALEHDPTGVFGRQGSIYDLLADAEQRTARISVNAWGANGGFGEYTSDSRSVDTYVSDTGDLVPLFSVGDQGANGDIAKLRKWDIKLFQLTLVFEYNR